MSNKLCVLTLNFEQSTIFAIELWKQHIYYLACKDRESVVKGNYAYNANNSVLFFWIKYELLLCG